jgi:hypothetical protein
MRRVSQGESTHFIRLRKAGIIKGTENAAAGLEGRQTEGPPEEPRPWGSVLP